MEMYSFQLVLMMIRPNWMHFFFLIHRYAAIYMADHWPKGTIKTLVRLHVWNEARLLMVCGWQDRYTKCNWYKKSNMSTKNGWLLINNHARNGYQKRIASNFNGCITFLMCMSRFITNKHCPFWRALLNSITVTIYKNVWLANNSTVEEKILFIRLLNCWRKCKMHKIKWLFLCSINDVLFTRYLCVANTRCICYFIMCRTNEMKTKFEDDILCKQSLCQRHRISNFILLMDIHAYALHLTNPNLFQSTSFIK